MRPTIPTLTEFGVRSSTAQLREVLVKRPGAAFGAAFENSGAGFRRPVDLAAAQREHDELVETLERLGVRVHLLDAEVPDDPDLVYVFDPLLITDRGAVALRPGKPSRDGEAEIIESWTAGAGIPAIGSIASPGTVEAGDTIWLREGCSASVARCEPTTPERASWRHWWAARSRSSISPTGADRPSSCT